MAARFEAQAIAGAGTGENILGILKTPGIGSVVGGPNGLAPTWSHIVELESDVSTPNDLGRRYLTNSETRRKLKTTLKNGAGTDAYVWPDGLQASLNGYPALVTDLVPSALTKGTSEDVCSAIINGEFRDLALGFWGRIQILADPYTLDTTGRARLSASI